MAVAIRSGKLSLDELVTQLQNSGGALDKTAGSAGTMSGKMNRLKNQLTIASSKLGDVLLPILETIVGWLVKAADWFGTLPGPIQTVIVVAGLLLAAIVPLGIGIGGLVAGVTALNLAFLANPITWVVLAIAALVAGIIWAWNNVDWFRNAITGLWGAVQSAFTSILDIFKNVWGWVSQNWPLLLGVLTGPFGAAAIFVATHWDTVKGWFFGFVTWLRSLFMSVVGVIVAPFQRAWEGIQAGIAWVGNFFTAFVSRMTEFGQGLYNALTWPFRTGINLIIGLINTLIGVWNSLHFEIHTPDIPGTDMGGVDFAWESPNIPVVPVPGMSKGGLVTGRGRRDTELRRLTPGEYVLSREQVAAMRGGTPPPAVPGGRETQGGVTVQSLVVNNPAAERASDTLPRTVRKLAYLGGVR